MKKRETIGLLLLMATVVGLLTLTGCGSDASKGQQGEAETVPDSIVKETAVVKNVEETASPVDQDQPTSGSQPSSAEQVYSTSDDGYLNIRKEPSAKAEIIGRLKTGGEGAKYLGEQNGWYKVDYYGAIGYVNSKFAKYDGVRASAKSSNGQKIYYLVVGSYETLANARKGTGEVHDWMACPVYRAEEKGVVKYRLCYACFYTKEKALREKRKLDEVLNGSREVWIWESNGLAECVFRPGSMRDANEPVPVLSPQ